MDESSLGSCLPAFWDVKLPSLGTFSVRGVALDQEVVPSAGGEPYWKGAVELQDEATGGEQIGVGFVELTGYAAPVHLSPTKMRMQSLLHIDFIFP